MVPAGDEALQEIPELRLADAVEEADQVAPEHPRLPGVVERHPLESFFDCLDGLERAEVLPAVERDVPLGLEPFLEEGNQAQADPVMDDAVPEVGREHLAEFRVLDQEAGRRTGLISSSVEFDGELEKIFVGNLHVLQRLGRRPFPAHAVVIRLDDGQIKKREIVG